MTARPGSPLTDAQLIAAASRHPERFAEVFDRHWSSIRRYCVNRVGIASGEDLAAETFRIALDRRRHYDLTRESAAPWLFGIATYLLAQDRRRSARQSRAFARLRPRPELDIAESALDRAQAQALGPELRRALDGISTASREALLLHVWAELSYDQIAEATGVSVGTVRSRIHRARARLQSTLDKEAALS